ncbi:hypothetical protein GCM10011297_12020 [Bacterioplanes sanyensis]|uniref:recombination protein RecR n=1 Tax=Bacterioplanes sanyensis TaxID=1249553 RepID=UPI001672B5DE|nr:recombination protein RecR [Bacterioplanes sanyensis]GGY40684.1 hypothetical protein GCM10011297_12020 [Bacterioplanes sanyensis]
MALAPAHQQLIRELQRLPGVGPNAAARWSEWLLTRGNGTGLAQALSEALAAEHCQQCRRLASGPLCRACEQVEEPLRLAVVASEQQADKLLATGYPGYCFICHGRLSPSQGVGPEALGFMHLIDRNWQRVDALFGRQVEDQATVLYLRQLFHGRADVHHITEEDGWQR